MILQHVCTLASFLCDLQMALFCTVPMYGGMRMQIDEAPSVVDMQ